MGVSRPRGTRDFTPEEMALRREMEQRLRSIALNYGYGEVATPTFEHADLFIRRSGEEVVKQMYIFEDKGGRQLALRPELTAPVARFYAERLDREYPKPLKLFYFGNAFRYERTQKGRYREFWQFGVECIGSPRLEADAEIIEMAYHMIQAMGVESFTLKLGHIGMARRILQQRLDDISTALTLIDRENFDGLREYITETLGSDEAQWMVSFFSSRIPLEEVARISEMTDDPGVEDLKYIAELLTSVGVSGVISPGIVRGLDYYTGIVFEIEAPSLGAEKQICGGGRYDLSEAIGKKMDATGFAIGFDRALLAIENPPELERREGVFVIPMGEEQMPEAFGLASHLRREGIRAEVELMGRKLGKALAYADAKHYLYAAIIGENEVAKGTVALKDLSTREQREVPRSELIDILREKL